MFEHLSETLYFEAKKELVCSVINEVCQYEEAPAADQKNLKVSGESKIQDDS